MFRGENRGNYLFKAYPSIYNICVLNKIQVILDLDLECILLQMSDLGSDVPLRWYKILWKIGKILV